MPPIIGPKTKRIYTVISMIVFVLALLFYDVFVIAEFYTSRFGHLVKAHVIDNSEVCRLRKKRLKLAVDGRPEVVRLYGFSCRVDEFPRGHWVDVRVNRKLDIITLDHHAGTIRIILFPIMTILVIIGVFLYLRPRKEINREELM